MRLLKYEEHCKHNITAGLDSKDAMARYAALSHTGGEDAEDNIRRLTGSIYFCPKDEG